MTKDKTAYNEPRVSRFIDMHGHRIVHQIIREIIPPEPVPRKFGPQLVHQAFAELTLWEKINVLYRMRDLAYGAISAAIRPLELEVREIEQAGG